MTPPAGLLLAPGAGAGRDQPGLVAVEAALADSAVVVERMDFPYRLAGRRAPDRPAVLLSSVVSAAGDVADRLGKPPQEISLGGRSMGGRICSMAAAAGLPCSSLVLMSYPLHPPGKPEKLRTEHFAGISVPCLFVSGTRDAFGTPAELETATQAIPAPVRIVWVEGADHGLRNRDAQVAAIVKEWLVP